MLLEGISPGPDGTPAKRAWTVAFDGKYTTR
jgi:hypothetical protein